MLALLIVVFGCGPVLLYQFLTWDAEPARLRRLTRDLRGVRFTRTDVVSEADAIVREAFSREAI